ncbi:hypothetical protein JCM19231_5131 [Vibrio ishigakensis]|uniref:Uncharacterized protein n=1 Tax=Vibrio ishigakensis TaxID=1481914 RepID=A0A0B8NX35_9VIBR|nr:hypothetical protein [Vibrio ishigakensis]GAM55299.1 hypothetical protein JCM19231_5131 [Vibrio ishigakensis]
MTHRNVAFSAITISALMVFYFVGAFIAHDSFGFVTAAVVVICFTVQNKIKLASNKSNSVATQRTIEGQ